ncbi:hypothetical protein BS614_28360 [Paenibacillus xylanexedens]|uniref:hypothetical protein n=1 Tax=Paenibacillus xylanexedens TaxID=528191 RepID=UPI0009381923|nr:hypothetical protein [Paenibacillus xylanexedens]APO47570.1 hypothetical protein BS614_28360 [Paenibacillus xylanexedens]
MNGHDRFEHASVAIAPFDDEYYHYDGCVLNKRYIFFIDENVLWLREVQPDPNDPSQYMDGESGGIAIGNIVKDNVLNLTTELVTHLRSMDALDFLTKILLCTPERCDFNLQLDRLILDQNHHPRGQTVQNVLLKKQSQEPFYYHNNSNKRVRS